MSPSPAPTAAALHETTGAGAPWWRFGMVWLVLGGPAVVVVASVATFVIAARYGDTPLPPEAMEASHTALRAAPDRLGAPPTAPALQGRNHAVTPQR